MSSMTVDDLRRTIDLYHLAGRDTNLRKAGANWYAGPLSVLWRYRPLHLEANR